MSSRTAFDFLTRHVKFLAFVALAFFALGLITNKAFSKDGGGGYVGPVLGMTMPSGGSSSLTLGFKGAYKVIPIVRGAIYYYKFGAAIESTTGVNTITATSSTSILGVEGVYPFSGSFAAGLKLGKMTNALDVSTTVNSTTTSFSDSGDSYFIGPTIQYDYPIGGFSAGGELNYLHALSSTVPAALQIMAAGKYWF